MQPDHITENASSRRELIELVEGLRPDSFQQQVGPNWTVASTLCHLAFWDQRVLYLVREWSKTNGLDVPQLNTVAVDSINQAVNRIALLVPGPAAATLAVESATAADEAVEQIGSGLAAAIESAGFGRYLRRSMHRREHIGRIRDALNMHDD